MITADDIAALVVLADRAAPFQHRLPRKFIDLHWILDRDANGTAAPSLVQRALGESPLRVRDRRPAFSLDVASPPAADDGNGKSDRHAAGGSAAGSSTPEPQRSTTPADQRLQRQHSSSSAAASPPAAGSSTTTTRAALPSIDVRGLDSVDWQQSEEDLDAKAALNRSPTKHSPSTSPSSPSPSKGRSRAVAPAALVTSPRSALVLLRNGFSVADLLGVPQKKIRNQALLDGAPPPAVQARLDADAKRRRMRREMVLADYRALCVEAPRDDVVEAMRDHFFAIVREDQRNSGVNRTQLQPLVPIATAKTALLDEECLDALTAARERAAGELSRVVDQTERQRRRILASEEALLQRQAALAGEAKQSNIHRDRILNAKKAATRERIEQAMERSRRLLEAEADRVEQRRSEIVEQREHIDDRAVQRRRLTRVATKALVKSVQERRDVVKRKERELADVRRDEIEAKTQFKDVLHRRLVDERLAELKQRREAAEAKEAERREALRERAESETRRREAALDELMGTAEKRAVEIAQARVKRREDKKARAVAKRERLAMTQAQRVEHEKRRLAALDATFAEKERLIERAEAERQRHIAEALERKALVQQEREEEHERGRRLAEYKYVGYVAANHHKTAWMEREAAKRRTLGLQLRQEREAMARSRDEMLHEIDSFERQERRRLELQFR